MVKTKANKLPIKFTVEGSRMSITGNIMLIRDPLRSVCSFYQVHKQWNKEKKCMDIQLGYTKSDAFIDKFKLLLQRHNQIRPCDK